MKPYTLAEISDRFKGTLVGAAIGDALGNPVEGFFPQEIKLRYGVLQKYQPHWDDAGTYTDDTELTLAVADSIVEFGVFSLRKTAEAFKQWLAHANSFGVACQAGVVNLINGFSPLESGIDSAGNGAAMRTSPLGLFYSHPKDKKLLRDATVSCARITHNNPVAVGGALAISSAVAYLLQNSELDAENFLRRIYRDVKGTSKQLARKISGIEKILQMPEQEAIREVGTSGYALESVPFAIYSFLRSPLDFEQTVIRAVNAGGDTDTNASIAGALSGAHNGLGALPKRLISGLNGLEKILATAQCLFDIYLFNLPKSEKSRIEIYNFELGLSRALKNEDYNLAAEFAGKLASASVLEGSVNRGIAIFEQALQYPQLTDTSRCLLQLLAAKSYAKINRRDKAREVLADYKSESPHQLAARDLLMLELAS